MGGFAKSAGVDRNVWCFTGEGKLGLVRIIENFGKPRVRFGNRDFAVFV